jgi:hypothetical protein
MANEIASFDPQKLSLRIRLHHSIRIWWHDVHHLYREEHGRIPYLQSHRGGHRC